MYDDKQIAYWAGFFDGEGCVSIQEPYTHPRPYLIFANNNEAAIREAHAFFACGKVYKQKPWRVWQLFIMRADDVKSVAEIILPYIKIKNKQLQLAVELARLVSLTEQDDRVLLLRFRVSEIIKEENQKRGCGVNTNQPR